MSGVVAMSSISGSRSRTFAWSRAASGAPARTEARASALAHVEIGIAHTVIGLLHSAPQRFRALGARPMGEAFGADLLPGLPLERIVADRARGAQPFLHVARIDQAAVLAGPDAGIAVRLQFHPHLQLVG